jgi:hypothetical protein
VSERTITLRPAHLARLRAGKHIWWDDSTNREVLLRMDGSDMPESYDEALVAVLTVGDLDLIAGRPEGLVVADVTRTIGWTIRTEAAR